MKLKSSSLGNESGQGLTEYIILLMLISVVSIATVTTLGKTVKNKITEASKAIESDVTH